MDEEFKIDQTRRIEKEAVRIEFMVFESEVALESEQTQVPNREELEKLSLDEINSELDKRKEIIKLIKRRIKKMDLDNIVFANEESRADIIKRIMVIREICNNRIMDIEDLQKQMQRMASEMKETSSDKESEESRVKSLFKKTIGIFRKRSQQEETTEKQKISFVPQVYVDTKKALSEAERKSELKQNKEASKEQEE